MKSWTSLSHNLWLHLTGGSVGRGTVPYPCDPGCPLLPPCVAICEAASGGSFSRGSPDSCPRLALGAFPPHRQASEPWGLLCCGLPMGQGQRSTSRCSWGTRAGCGTTQWLLGYAGALPHWSGHCGVAIGEQQPACDWRWGLRKNAWAGLNDGHREATALLLA